MLRYLAPRVFVVTPNHSELRLLSGQDDLTAGVQTLFDAGVRHVLVTDAGGGRTVRHALFSASTGAKPHWFAATYRRAHKYHGSGCFFSSTLAARLALKDRLPLPPSSPTKKRWRPCAPPRSGRRWGRKSYCEGDKIPLMRRILVTAALPYANGDIHLGYLTEVTQADIWVRFQKMRGHECHYVCADDAHGTPVMLRAESENITPEELIDKMQRRTCLTLPF